MMLALISRFLLLVAGSVASWFVAKDAVNFATIEMTVAILLFVATVLAAAFWPPSWIRKLTRF